jgi:DNA-binding MarR family transcriptional regulator
MAEGAGPLPDWETLSRTLRPENSPGFLLWQVANQWQRVQRAGLEPLGLTHAQFVLLAGLAWLVRKEGAATQARLAAFCKTDPMMTSQIVRALEAAGLITRRRHPTDNRARQLQLTPAGTDRLNAAMPVVLASDARYFGAPAESQPLVDTLRLLWRRAARFEGG